MVLEIEGTTTKLENLSLTARANRISYDHLTAFDMGPVSRGDNSEGLYAYAWRIRADGNDVYISRANDANTAWQAEELLFTYTGSVGSEFGLTFDQVGRPLVSFQQDDNVVLYWYDSAAGATVVSTICAGRTPRIRLDFRSSHSISSSDILLFYIDDTENKVLYRIQRDRFGVVYDSGITSSSSIFLEELCPGKNNRMYLYYTDVSEIDAEACTCTGFRYWHSAPYPVHSSADTEIGTSQILSGSKEYKLPLEDDYYWLAELDLENVSLNTSFILSGQKREIIHEKTIEMDSVEIGASDIVSGSLREIIHEYTADIESVELGSGDIVDGSLRQIIIEATTEIDSAELGVSEIVSGSKEAV